MATPYMTLRPPRAPRLARPRSTVLNPLSRQTAAPVPMPDYGQQISGFQQRNVAPQFSTAAVGSGGGALVGGSPYSGQFHYGAGDQTPQVPQGTMTGGTPSPGGDAMHPSAPAGFDVSSDPIYQQAQAAYQQQVAQAEAASLGAERTNLIRYGSGDLMKQVLGGQATQADIQAANANSFGTVQELGRWNERALGGVDTSANRSNLYFSSTRARDRGLQEEDYQRQGAKTAGQLQDVLTQIAQGLLAAKQQAQAGLLSAAEGAYNRYLQQILAQRYYGGQGAGGDGGGGDAQPPPPDGAGGTGGGGYGYDPGQGYIPGYGYLPPGYY